MKKSTKIKIFSGVAALAIAAGFVLSSPRNVNTVRKVVHKIYDEQTDVDDQLVRAYIKTLNDAYEAAGNHMSREYEPGTIIRNNNELFELTEWIPELEEVQANYELVKTR